MGVRRVESDGGLGMVLTLTGVVEERELIQKLHDHLYQPPEVFRRYRYSLIDAMEVTEFNVSSEAIRKIASECTVASKKNDDGIVALVVKSVLLFGLSRMYLLLSSGNPWEINVFRQKKEAESWLKKKANERWRLDGLTFS